MHSHNSLQFPSRNHLYSLPISLPDSQSDSADPFFWPTGHLAQEHYHLTDIELHTIEAFVFAYHQKERSPLIWIKELFQARTTDEYSPEIIKTLMQQTLDRFYTGDVVSFLCAKTILAYMECCNTSNTTSLFSFELIKPACVDAVLQADLIPPSIPPLEFEYIFTKEDITKQQSDPHTRTILLDHLPVLDINNPQPTLAYFLDMSEMPNRYQDAKYEATGVSFTPSDHEQNLLTQRLKDIRQNYLPDDPGQLEKDLCLQHTLKKELQYPSNQTDKAYYPLWQHDISSTLTHVDGSTLFSLVGHSF